MRKLIAFCLFFVIISFSLISCKHNPDTKNSTESTESPKPIENKDSTDSQEETKDNFPKLEIINKGQLTITSVSLEGYNFSNLSLKQNKSIIFELKDGMPAGYKNVRISIRYRPYKVINNPVQPIITHLDFADGETSQFTITSNIF